MADKHSEKYIIIKRNEFKRNGIGEEKQKGRLTTGQYVLYQIIRED